MKKLLLALTLFVGSAFAQVDYGHITIIATASSYKAWSVNQNGAGTWVLEIVTLQGWQKGQLQGDWSDYNAAVERGVPCLRWLDSTLNLPFFSMPGFGSDARVQPMCPYDAGNMNQFFVIPKAAVRR